MRHATINTRVTCLIILMVMGLAFVFGCATANKEDTAGKMEKPQTEAAYTTPHEITTNIRQRIDNPHSIIINSQTIKASSYLASLYKQYNYVPMWSSPDGPLPQAYEMVEVIKDSYMEGLNPEAYKITEIENTLDKIKAVQDSGNSARPEDIAELDLLLTNAFLLYSKHILYGQVTPEQIDLELIFGERRIDLSELLVTSIKNNNVKETLDGLLPKYPVYSRLRSALAHYRELEALGGWNPVPPGPKFKKGSRGPRVTALKERLIVTGDLNKTGPVDDIFDSTLDQAVRTYQDRNGLYVDGVVGESTLESLNVPVEQRIHQIVLTMERWRLLPQNMGPRYILVNIANFHLYAVQNNTDVLNMRIVVGKPKWNTPIFSEMMTHLVVNPYWNIPPSIFRDDIAPRIRSDPDYMSNRNIQAVGLNVEKPESEDAAALTEAKEEYISKVLSGNYRLRQNPGPSNPLGRIKFLFPNKYSVYLHDTPNRGYFQRAQRNFSHGCIRIENPIGLAEFVMSPDPTWNDEKVKATINRGRTQTVHLPEPLTVYILYFTAWAEEDGSVNFHKDIYGLDQVLQNALNDTRARRVDMATNIH
jgi:murein L,D-transpeptidase YcbB/YkuD